MWNARVYELIAQNTRAGGSFATYTAAGDVRRGLSDAGFEVRKCKGSGAKRDMLKGFIVEQRCYSPRKPWYSLPDVTVEHKNAVIIGAGLSGTFVVSGSPTKTQMVDGAGGHSQLAQITTVLVVLLVILFLTGPLAYMPEAVLAAIVFMIGLEEGLLPHERSADDPHELEEERRLCFVGITRARKTLQLSHARFRTVRGQTLRTVASPFLRECGLIVKAAVEPRVKEVTYDTTTTQVRKPKAPYSKGQLVRHGKFGLGRVQGYVDMGESSTVTVQFNSGATITR